MKRLVAFMIPLALALTFLNDAGAQGRAEWLKKARWGVMTHYLPDWIEPQRKWTSEDWNKLVDGFDAEGLAKQLEAVGAGYYLISIGQNSGFYLAPNATYDRLVDFRPSKCSRRDLVADLYAALRKRGIKLMVYLPSGAPNKDQAAVKALEWKNGPYPNREFLAKWEQVVRDWSLRWGDKVSGWWFDGCYWPNTMYRSPEAPNFQSLAAAARAGNRSSIVAFNPGVVYRTLSVSPHEDFIAGEIDHPDRLSIRRVFDGNVDGSQLHMLSYLGQTWGKGAPRFASEQVVKWTRDVIGQGGAVTWDAPVQTNGLISQPYIEQLNAVKGAFVSTPSSQGSSDHRLQ
jgi:alpha-L-fucosidase